jgi:glycosyltransferase involved in cell wall biosynthesis
MELFHLAHLGRRLVVTFQDLISYNAPHYFPEYQRYDDYLRVTRDVFAAADRVLFFSPHAREEARRAGLITDDRTDVVLLGTDHAHVGDAIVPRRPEALDDSERDPFVLCLGTDFRHKNREFALQVFRELRARHGWAGRLIFAGPHVSEGSSRGAEGEAISEDPLLRDSVVDLAAVNEDEKLWLLEHASVVLYPTTIEGFGLVPFEAAAAGTPCVFAPVASLRDLFPVELGLLEPWNARAGADAVMRVMTDDDVAGALVAGILESGSRLRWDDAARGFINAYDAAIRDPRPASGDNVVRAILREQHALSLEQQMSEMVLATGNHGGRGTPFDQALGDPDGPVPEEVKRAALAVASRRWLRTPIFGAIKLPYRLKGKSTLRPNESDQ